MVIHKFSALRADSSIECNVCKQGDGRTRESGDRILMGGLRERVELATSEQASKLSGGDDRHAAVVGGFKILVSRHEILRWGTRGE